MAEEPKKKGWIRVVYQKELDQKIAARKQMLKEFHPESAKAQQAAQDLEELEQLREDIG